MLKSSATIFVACTMMLSFYSFSQTTRIDSLKNKITTTNDPVKKLQSMLVFCDEWESFNADTLHKYALLTRQSAVSLQNSDAILFSDYYLAAYLFQKNRLDTALNKINQVLTQIKKTTGYNSSYVKFYMLRNNILLRTLRYDEVLKQNFALLPLAEKYNDTVGLIRINTSIGNVNLRLKKYEEALKWHYRAINGMNTDDLKARCSFVYINIAVVYYHLAFINDNKQNEDSIEINLERAIKYSRQGNSLTNLANGLSMYGNILAEYKKIIPAEAALTEALETRKKIGDIYYVITDMVALSSLYKNSNQPARAIAVCLQALELAKQNGSDASSLIGIYSSLGELYNNTEEYKKYSAVLLERFRLLDSMYKVNSAEAISEMETKYDTQKKETVILQQKLSIARKNYIIYTIAGLGLLVLLIVWLVLKNRKYKQQQRIKEILTDNERKTRLAIDKAKEEERRRIIADLHDDVGGGLSTIRMISDLITGQTAHALKLEQYAVKISGITKDVTQRMNTIVWALNTENDTLQNLCEYIREYGFAFFENSTIEFKSNLIEAATDVELSGLQRKNLFLVVKECLNNVYKHSGAKRTWVNIEFADGMLSVEIKDDGKGITNEKTSGNGLKNMQKRMKEINGEVIFNAYNGTSVLLKVFVSSTVFKTNEMHVAVN